MSEAYFSPWVGEHYSAERLLVMSESTYDWTGDDGDVCSPSPSHAKDSIPWHIEHFGQNRYFTALNRALCNTATPTKEIMQRAWDRCAYTVFVQESVGYGPGVRPKGDHWKDAGIHFLALIEELKPKKVIVTGVDMWNQMPECSLRLVDDIQAYRLSNDELVWCLALPHPANRTRGKGFAWQKMAESIRLFSASTFGG